MNEKIYQCCYTNFSRDIGGRIESGWQTVAVSDNIPPEAHVKCRGFQSTNSAIEKTMTDEDGNTLNLFEIIGDGKYIYVMRTQYGLSDRFGRMNMFSHALIFPCEQDNLDERGEREDIVRYPNQFLNIKNSCFKSNEAEASGFKDNLKIEYDEGFTLNEAVNIAGLTPETYITLTQCVFACFSDKKASRPLYVQCDGGESRMRALLYCIYSAVPYYIRKYMSVSSCTANNSDSKTIVFSKSAKEHELYFIPQSGENSILSERIKKRISRLEFVDYAVHDYENKKDEKRMNQYFYNFNVFVKSFGDITSYDEIILKIAHKELYRRRILKINDYQYLKDSEIDACLSDALRTKPSGKERMEKYIGHLLVEICRRKLSLTEENERSLKYHVSKASTDDLKKTYKIYEIYCLSRLDVESGIQRLDTMSEDEFFKYQPGLSKNDNGKNMLREYYNPKICQAESFERLKRIWKDAGSMQDDCAMIKSIKERAWEIYDNMLADFERGQDAYYQYCQIIKSINGEISHEDDLKAKKKFWENRRYQEISFDENVGRACKELNDESDKCKIFTELYKIGKSKSVFAIQYFSDIEDVLGTLYELFRKYNDATNGLFYDDAWTIAEKMPNLLSVPKEYYQWFTFVHKFVYEKNYGCDFYDLMEFEKKSVSVKDCDEAWEFYQKFKYTEDCIKKYSNEKIMNLLDKCSRFYCNNGRIDQMRECLKRYLILGRLIYNNQYCFNIFDQCDPVILEADKEIICKLFLDEFELSEEESENYRKWANDNYINRKGKNAKIIKQWMDWIEKEEKMRGKAQKKNEERNKKEQKIKDNKRTLEDESNKITDNVEEFKRQSEDKEDAERKKGSLLRFWKK